MAGKVQHEIPRLFQRGFLIPGPGERVFVFRSDGKAFPSNIDRSAAESYFYSRPSMDGSETLDDVITAYEGRLAELVKRLRSVPAGGSVDPNDAAETIAHLTTRNAHLRGAFSQALRGIASRTLGIFGDEEAVRRLLGLDWPTVTDVFRDKVVRVLADSPSVAGLAIPPLLLEKLLFATVREGVAPLLAEAQPALESAVSEWLSNISENVQKAHNNALSKSVAPKARIEGLAAFHWRSIQVDRSVILPDCVAVAVARDGSIDPLMLADIDLTDEVWLPLESNKILVGVRGSESMFDPEHFNAAAASCSHTYFIAGSDDAGLRDLMLLIGKRSVSVVDGAIDDAVAELAPSAPIHEAAAVAVEPSPLPHALTVHYRGAFDESEMKRINDALSVLLGALAWRMPFDRLDGVTFADDYVQALQDLDRGRSDLPPLASRQDSVAIGIGQCPNVFRDGVVKGHVVAVGALGRALAGEDEGQARWAAAALADLIAEAGILQVFDETLPGVILQRECVGFESELHACTYPSWQAYFSSIATADIDETRLSIAQDILLGAIDDLYARAVAARFDYRFHRDIPRLIAEVRPLVSYFLQHAASLWGLADGMDQPAFVEGSAVENALAARELLPWFHDFRRDLAWLWDRRGRWESYDEFLALNRHAERIFWTLGMVPWTTPEGQDRLEVPLRSDAPALLKWASEHGLPPNASNPRL